MFQLSAEYFHSSESPGAKDICKCQILSPSASAICQQFPHHPLKIPLTSGMVNDCVTPLISNSNVTSYAEGPELQLLHDSQHTTERVVSPETFSVLFVKPQLVIVHQEPESKFSCIPQLSAENLNS